PSTSPPQLAAGGDARGSRRRGRRPRRSWPARGATRPHRPPPLVPRDRWSLALGPLDEPSRDPRIAPGRPENPPDPEQDSKPQGLPEVRAEHRCAGRAVQSLYEERVGDGQDGAPCPLKLESKDDQ